MKSNQDFIFKTQNNINFLSKNLLNNFIFLNFILDKIYLPVNHQMIGFMEP